MIRRSQRRCDDLKRRSPSSKMHDPRRYHRMLQDLSRIWVRLLPGSAGNFNWAARACQLDTRFALDLDVSIAEIAGAIIHEATHARNTPTGVSRTR